MAHATHILSFGYDPVLLQLRSMVLRSRGYAVEEAYTLATAFHAVQSDVIDVMLICHTVPPDERHRLIASVRSLRRLLPVLCITTEELAYSTGDCLTVTNSPLELLHAVMMALAGPAPNAGAPAQP
jgi:DNA-binding response OmpR family regulator